MRPPARARTRRNGAGKALMLRREFVTTMAAWGLDWRGWAASPGASVPGACPYMDNLAADALTWMSRIAVTPPPRFADDAAAAVGVADWRKQEDDALADSLARAREYDRRERAIEERSPYRDVYEQVRKPTAGGCGDGSVSPASPRLPGNGERFDITVAGGGADGWGLLDQDDEKRWAAIEQAYAEEGESWGRLSPHPDITPLDPDWEPGMPPAPPHVAGDGDDPRPELDETRVDVIPSGTYMLDAPQPPGHRKQP